MKNAYISSIDAVAAHYNAHTKEGLTTAQVEALRKEYGENGLPEAQQTSLLWVFCQQFLSPLMFVLFIAAFISLLIGKVSDAFVISIAGFVNVIVGFVQEWRAKRAAKALQSYESFSATVMRDGKTRAIDARQLVPGDIVILNAGARVPADIRLFDTANMVVEEAILTGESVPVRKDASVTLSEDTALGDRANMAYMGTFVLEGRGVGLVSAIGNKTELGRIALLVENVGDESTPIQKHLTRFSWLLGGAMLAISTVIGGISYVRGYSYYDIFSLSIALAIAAIPEGLLIAVTVVLAVGMQRMARKNALIKRLVAAETLGSVSVICTDKTGTLTEGYLSVAKLITPNIAHTIQNESSETSLQQRAIEMLVLNNDAFIDEAAETRVGDPLELALVALAQKNGSDVRRIREQYPRIDEIPFAAEHKYMMTLHAFDDTRLLILKGAPEVVFAKSAMDGGLRADMTHAVEEMTTSGLRVIAFAAKTGDGLTCTEDEDMFTFEGLVGFSDKVRAQAPQTVQTLQRAGVRLVLVTGDHEKTAAHVARESGIGIEGVHVYTGKELREVSQAVLDDKIEDIAVFARVEPVDKVRIVKAWKAQDAYVAMTGDGVNDAPALRAADIGIALGAGSGVTHDIADMVLLDNNLASIVAAVKEGRLIFENMRKVIAYLLVDSFTEVFLIGGAILFGLPLPLLPVQILWINVISDGLPYLALTIEPAEETLMSMPPRPFDEPLVNKDLMKLIFVIGIIADIGLLLLCGALYWLQYPIDHLRTVIFTALGVNSLLYVFSVRSFRQPMFKVNIFRNIWLCVAVAIGFVLQLSTIYLPFLQPWFSTVYLSAMDGLVIVVLALVKLIAIESSKYYIFRDHISNTKGSTDTV